MRTYEGLTSTFNFNGDYLGDVIIVSNYGLGEVRIDFADIVDFLQTAIEEDGLDIKEVLNVISTNNYKTETKKNFEFMKDDPRYHKD